MRYDWDPAKAETNARKHGIQFADAVSVFADDRALVADDAPDEDRFVTLGLDAFGRLGVVVYTWRGDTIRIISARKATPAERRAYER